MVLLVTPFLTTLIVFLGMDALWLGYGSGSLYHDVLGEMMLDGFRILPAIAFYVMHVAGILIFVITQERVRASLWTALIFGNFYGICTYGTYDLTNYAVLKPWTLQLTVTDMAWGGIVTAVASLAGAWTDRRVRRAYGYGYE